MRAMESPKFLSALSDVPGRTMTSTSENSGMTSRSAGNTSSRESSRPPFFSYMKVWTLNRIVMPTRSSAVCPSFLGPLSDLPSRLNEKTCSAAIARCPLRSATSETSKRGRASGSRTVLAPFLAFLYGA